MTIPVLDGLEVTEVKLDVDLDVTDQDPVELREGHYYRCQWVMPVRLFLHYRRTPTAPEWSARWGIKGRKLLKGGRWSDHIGGYVDRYDVAHVPEWVVAALRAHHPDPAQLPEEDQGDS